MRFFTFLRENETPILYKMDPEGLSNMASDLSTFTIIPISDNFAVEYQEKDNIVIAERNDAAGNQFGFFDNGFVLDITLRELKFDNVDQFISFIKSDNIKVINWFLESGIDVNKEDMYGNYPIMYVKNFYILKMLCARNATFNQIHTNCDNNFTEPVYNFIIYNFNYKLYIVKYLMKHGLDVTLTDGNQEHFLYRTNNYQIHKIFMKNGLNITSVNNLGQNIIDKYHAEHKDSIYSTEHYKLWTST